MYLVYVYYLELIRIYDMTDNLANSQPRHLAMFFGQALQPWEDVKRRGFRLESSVTHGPCSSAKTSR